MPPGCHEHMAENRGLSRKKGDDAFVSIDLAHIGVVVRNDLAELTNFGHHMRTFAWATQPSRLLARFMYVAFVSMLPRQSV